ncbi:MAG: transposase [Streptosporangiaceae bacterium]
MPATFSLPGDDDWSVLMAAVMIGVDPHKGSHTAVVIGPAEEPLGELRVCASAAQAGKLGCAAQAGLAGAAAAAGDTNKDDPNDALSVAVAALRSRTCRQVTAEDYAGVLKVWSKRHRDLARNRNQVACRLHAVLCDLVPGGHQKEIYAAQAARILEQVSPSGAVALARAELAAEFLADLRHPGDQLRETKKKLAAAVRASRTTLTDVFGVGPVVAGTIIGDIGDVSRFPGPDHFAACNGTAPAGVSSGNRKVCRLSLRGNRRINHAIHMAAITQLRYKHSPGRAHYDKKTGEGKTHKEALRSLKRRISDAIFASRPMPARPRPPGQRAREGNRGTTLTPARPAHTPNASSSDKPLPDLPPPYGPAIRTRTTPPKPGSKNTPPAG